MRDMPHDLRAKARYGLGGDGGAERGRSISGALEHLDLEEYFLEERRG